MNIVRKTGLVFIFMCLVGGSVQAAIPDDVAGDVVMPSSIRMNFDAAGSPQEVSQSIKIMLLITALSLAPSAIIMTTSFLRILIVLGILRQAMGVQNIPPGQVLAGIALFLTLFTMAPVWEEMNNNAIKPYMAHEISQNEAWDKALKPLRGFMLKQTGESEMSLFVELSRIAAPKTPEDVPIHVLIPSFITSELKTSLQMAFLVYIPFLVIDLVVASSLMSLGMMMLPPMMVSLPLKILLFVLADGYTLLLRGLVSSFT